MRRRLNRRHRDITPADFIGGLAGYWRPDQGFVTLDTGVSALLDRSGNNRTAVQATGSLQPAFTAAHASSPKGRPAITFDTSDYLTIAHHLDLGNTQDWEGWAIGIPEANASNLILASKFTEWELQCDPGEHAQALLRNAGDTAHALVDSAVLSTSALNLIRWRADVSECEIGVAAATDALATDTDTGPALVGTADMYLGSRAGTAGNGWIMFELGLKKGLLTTEELGALVAYANDWHGMSLTPSWPSQDSFTIDFGEMETNATSVAVAGFFPDMVWRYHGLPTTGTGKRRYLDLMRVRSEADADARRTALNGIVFATGGPANAGGTDRGPTVVSDHTEYEMDMEGLHTSRAWLYSTVQPPTGWLLIVHGGHSGQGPEHVDLVDIRVDALAAGHDVVVLSMPGQGPNETAGPQGAYFGANGIMGAGHGNARFWDQHYLNGTSAGAQFGVPSFSAQHFFWAPVFRMINQIGGSYSNIAMTGLSGGCFTAGWCTAMDTRIRASYPVASFVPRVAAYEVPVDLGDAERQLKTHLDICNIEEAHILACTPKRRVIFTLNNEDDCCYRGDTMRLETFTTQTAYEAARIGGSWAFRNDVFDHHGWSAATRAAILADMAAIA